MENKAQLRIVENPSEKAAEVSAQEVVQQPVSAFEALATAKNAQEAFLLFQAWSESQSSLAAPARAVNQELLRGGFEVL